jgi:hypothetical protein
MGRYRIGNDMTILWAINDRNGAALPLNDKEVHLYYTCARGRYEADIEIQDDNVVVWNFLGNKQRVLGSYTLTLEILQSNGKRTIKKDICNAFVLVGKDCEEDYDNGEAHISEGREITLASKLDIYRISPVIPYIGEDGHWYIDGEKTDWTADGSRGMIIVDTLEDLYALTTTVPAGTLASVATDGVKSLSELYDFIGKGGDIQGTIDYSSLPKVKDVELSFPDMASWPSGHIYFGNSVGGEDRRFIITVDATKVGFRNIDSNLIIAENNNGTIVTDRLNIAKMHTSLLTADGLRYLGVKDGSVSDMERFVTVLQGATAEAYILADEWKRLIKEEELNELKAKLA